MNIASKLNQTAVWWARDGVLGGDGNRAYSAGVEVTVRWQNRREEFTNSLGKKEISRAIVYFDGEGDGSAITLGDKLYLGTLASLTAPQQADPNIVELAYRVKNNDLSPSIDASQTLRKAVL